MGQVWWKHSRTQGCTHGNSGCTLLATGAMWGRGAWAVSQDLEGDVEYEWISVQGLPALKELK